MDMALLLLFIAAVLFVIAYLAKRRFGVIGLALCAGSLLSTMWTANVTPLIQNAGVQLIAPPLDIVVAAGLVLLPVTPFLFSGPRYSKLWRRVFGAAAFTLLATAFLLVPLGTGLVLDDTTQEYYDFLVKNRDIIVTAAIVYAIYDILAYKPPKKEK